MKIDVIDMGDPVVGNDRANRVIQSSIYEPPNLIRMYPMSNGIVQMVDEVSRVASTKGSIDILRIWGHGWSGGQLVAAGADGQAGADNASALWGHNVFDFWPYLAKLAPFFNASGSHIELKGCEVAKGNDGELFLVKLALIFQAPVQAGVRIQGGENSLLTYGGSWDGIVLEARPDLSIRKVPTNVRIGDL
jgi:uncharacterized protein DUF4347